MNQGFSEQEVLIEQRGGLGVITLNRPKALNALSLEMIRQISNALRRWEKDKAITAIFFRGAGERAFCAGGDLKQFHLAGMNFRRGKVDSKVPAVFFAEEYSLNRQIFHYPKPTIAFMNGITMGGGFGIAGNCAHRIATEKTVFAMPETGIGFFPDVGSVYHLLRCPRGSGHYLALTGEVIEGPDMMHAALADYYIPSENEPNVTDALAVPGLADKQIREIFARFSTEASQDTEFFENLEKIEQAFETPDIHAVFAALVKDGSDWAEDLLALFRRRSPTSVLVTAEHLRQGEGQDFDEIIRTDFILSQRFVERMDLYEGIRAVLIDRDGNPKWDPATYDEISQADVKRYFAPTGYDLDDVQIFAA